MMHIAYVRKNKRELIRRAAKNTLAIQICFFFAVVDAREFQTTLSMVFKNKNKKE